MKRTVLLSAVLLSLAAVTAHAATCQVGVKGGVAIQKLGGDDVDSLGVDSRTGFTGGMFLQVDFSKSFATRIEGLYTQKGAKNSQSGLEVTTKLDYIEFPILLVGKIPASDAATVSAFAGPVLGFNTGASLEATGTLAGNLFTGSLDIKDQIAAFEFGLAFGLGASFDAGPVDIVLDGRYTLGLTTIDDSGNLDGKNRGFAFMAGVGFAVGGSE